MKSLLFSMILVSLTLSFNLIQMGEDNSTCEASYAGLVEQVAALPQRLDVTPKVYSQKVFDCVRAVPGVLDDCNQPLIHEQFDYYLPKGCINELQDLTTLYDQYDRATNNVTKTLYLSQLTARLATTFPLRCPHLYEVVKHFINRTTQVLVSSEITPDCGESAYQYSLLIQKLINDLSKHNQQFAQDISNVIVELPNTLDICGQTALATSIRNDFPKQCLNSFTLFGKVIEQFAFNHSHLQWVYANIHKLFGAWKQIKYTCPAF